MFIAAKKCDECSGLNEIKCVSICPMDAIKKQGQGGSRFTPLPSAIAAKIVYPNKKVIAVCGDGGFMMNS